MPVLHIPDTIRYQIIAHSTGATLCLWETAQATGSREQPFLFKVNQRVASKEEAQRLLTHYLEGFKAN